MSVDVELDRKLGPSAVFDSVEDASAFFERGSLGYSATSTDGAYDGLRLVTSAWRVEPVRVTAATSSFFDDRDRFPAGSAARDSAQLMRHVPADWEAARRLVDTA